MKIVIVGAGNVATHLAKALNKIDDVKVAQIWSNSYQNALQLANDIDALAIENLADIDQDADLCLIAIKDDAIAATIKKITGFKGLVAHTSGAIPLNVFDGEFIQYGVFYPLQTFSKQKEVSFNDIPICLEANTTDGLNLLKDLADKLSKRVLVIDSEKRKILHLAAVFACNFTNHLYALADEVLKANDLNFDILRPLITETANKVQNALPLAVQTGPAIRNDLATMQKHETLLENQPALLTIYKTLSESIKKTRK